MPSPQETISLAALLVQKCTSTTSLRKARQIHALILTTTPTTTQPPYVNNNILSMYARCGSLSDSQHLFDKMPQRNIVSYNALIAAYSRCPRHAHLAFKLLPQLEHECLQPNSATFTSLLQASSCLGDDLLGSAIHTQGIKFGFLSDMRVQTSLMGMYMNYGCFKCAERVFCDMVDKDSTAWNSVIIGYMRNGKISEGLRVFGGMARNGVIPTQFTYSMVLNACSRLGYQDMGRSTHAQVIVSGTATDLPLQNALLDMYCSCGDTQTAFNIFCLVEEPDLVSWNSMMAGYSGNGDGEEAMDMFNQLCQTCLARPDEFTFAAIISATGAFPALSYGKPLHAQVNKAGLESSVYVGSTLISMYFNNDESESAQMLFSSILEKDVVLWTEMISGHSRVADGESALKCFQGLMQDGHKIDSFALSSTLSACADLATLVQGEIIHSQAIKTGYNREMTVTGSLIDMYAKIGDWRAAEHILSQMDRPDLKCWNSMLGGYGHHGRAEEAFEVLDDILKQGLRPDQVTFISLLSACSHSGLVDKGKFIWAYMKENGLTPGPKHYSCMINLLGRAGLLVEAEEIILESAFGETTNMELWRTLLSSCVSSRNLRIGVRAAERILSIDTEDTATNILLSNLYAGAGRWDVVSELRRKFRGLMLEKDPGLSWIEAMNSIHVFSSGDQSHPEVDKMQPELLSLQANLLVSETEEFCYTISCAENTNNSSGAW